MALWDIKIKGAKHKMKLLFLTRILMRATALWHRTLISKTQAGGEDKFYSHNQSAFGVKALLPVWGSEFTYIVTQSCIQELELPHTKFRISDRKM